MRRFFGTIGATTALALGLAGAFASTAGADVVGPINFEPPAYTTGNINGQQGWSKTGPYDVEVADVSAFPAASHYFFGSQALRLSNAITSGSFGDQTFSPGLERTGRRGRLVRLRGRLPDRHRAVHPAARAEHVREPR